MRLHLIVRGRVQGVYFRGSTQAQARRAGVDGWVRNCDDGSVEAVLEGPREAVVRVLAFCRRGPPGARVDALEPSEEAPEGLSGFRIL